MNTNETINTYDESYALSYNHRFLTEEIKTLDELKVIQTLLKQKPDGRWLDLACGTGFYLRQFTEYKNRMGLDLSPDMLKVAQRINPDLVFLNDDFRNSSAVEIESFDVITSLWWAYSFAENLNQIIQFVENIKLWLKKDGICFVPIANISRDLLLSSTEVFPYYSSEDVPVYGGKMRMDAAFWSYIEPNGKVHKEMLVPHMQKMKEYFLLYFKHVEIIEYASGYYNGIIASDKQFDPYLFLSSELVASNIYYPEI